MSKVVLDASALLALLNEEPRSEQVATLIEEGAAMSTVNLSEVVAKLSEAGMPEEAIHEALDALGITMVDFDSASAYKAGLLRLATKKSGLSLGDRACLALAQQLGLPAVTTDRVWETLSIGITIQIARPSAKNLPPA
jgi:ribonuclease VapC